MWLVLLILFTILLLLFLPVGYMYVVCTIALMCFKCRIVCLLQIYWRFIILIAQHILITFKHRHNGDDLSSNICLFFCWVYFYQSNTMIHPIERRFFSVQWVSTIECFYYLVKKLSKLWSYNIFCFVSSNFLVCFCVCTVFTRLFWCSLSSYSNYTRNPLVKSFVFSYCLFRIRICDCLRRMLYVRRTHCPLTFKT